MSKTTKKTPEYFRFRGVDELPLLTSASVFLPTFAIALIATYELGFSAETVWVPPLFVASLAGLIPYIWKARQLGATRGDTLGMTFFGWFYKVWMQRRHVKATQPDDPARSTET